MLVVGSYGIDGDISVGGATEPQHRILGNNFRYGRYSVVVLYALHSTCYRHNWYLTYWKFSYPDKGDK
jgi:hypothetical protein